MDKQELENRVLNPGINNNITINGKTYIRESRALYLIGHLDEPEKPEIPKFVADWIEEVKQRGCGLADALNCFVSPIMPEKVKQWIQFDFAAIGCHHDNQELLAKAWLNGYAIQKEPAWVVKINEKLYFCRFTDKYFEKDSDAPTYIESGSPSLIKKFTNKDKAEAVAILVDGEVEEWSEKDEQCR